MADSAVYSRSSTAKFTAFQYNLWGALLFVSEPRAERVRHIPLISVLTVWSGLPSAGAVAIYNSKLDLYGDNTFRNNTGESGGTQG